MDSSNFLESTKITEFVGFSGLFEFFGVSGISEIFEISGVFGISETPETPEVMNLGSASKNHDISIITGAAMSIESFTTPTALNFNMIENENDSIDQTVNQSINQSID